MLIKLSVMEMFVTYVKRVGQDEMHVEKLARMEEFVTYVE
jgi:hypothetical protein